MYVLIFFHEHVNIMLKIKKNLFSSRNNQVMWHCIAIGFTETYITTKLFYSNLLVVLCKQSLCDQVYQWLRVDQWFSLGTNTNTNTNLLLSIMMLNILSRIIKWITYIWFHIDWFDWFYNKERKKDNITNE